MWLVAVACANCACCGKRGGARADSRIAGIASTQMHSSPRTLLFCALVAGGHFDLKCPACRAPTSTGWENGTSELLFHMANLYSYQQVCNTCCL